MAKQSKKSKKPTKETQETQETQNMRKVFKVVLSTVTEEGVSYFSVMAKSLPAELRCEYKMNQRVEPPIGKLFAFLSLEEAEAFKAMQPKSRLAVIMRCEAHGEVVNITGVDLPLIFSDTARCTSIMTAFWDGLSLDDRSLGNIAAAGTAICDALTPIAFV